MKLLLFLKRQIFWLRVIWSQISRKLANPLFIIQSFTMAWNCHDDFDNFDIQDNGELEEEVEEEEEEFISKIS